MSLLLWVIAIIAILSIGWRLASRRQSLPCPVWLSWLVERDNPFTKTNRAAVIIDCLDALPGMTLLDAGCGPGRLTVPLAELVGPTGVVVALDRQAGMLQRTQEKAHSTHLTNIHFVQAALGEGQTLTQRFDRAVLVTVLGEIPNRKNALLEIFEALNPGGILSVTEVIFDPHFQTRRTVLTLATQAGFRETAFFGHWFAYTLHLEKPTAV